MTTSPDKRHAVLDDAGVYVPASCAYPLWLALRAEAQQARTNGREIRPEVMAALDALRSAAFNHMSASRHGNRTLPHDRASDRLVTTQELAGRLGVTGRHLRRLATAAGITRAAWGLWATEDADRLAELRRTR
ncbi:hypothetical protein [Streptomyces sp. NBC_00878]|uniref:hypothetical protein n=1 Tax=Streptomyces sp. NBC_00878 TaxID=2975854 RepID=UPI002254786C|nr:hypothetical protein [Streptomyces sp. NBC_00878]MCX4908059.1 hypothetical protein [Streptomyces sp. NBC_00878]